MKQEKQTELETLKADIKAYFENQERMSEHPTSRTSYRDAMVRVENRLRNAVGLPIVAVQSKS
jgi:predicted HicB family RNase H-like nuclease